MSFLKRFIQESVSASAIYRAKIFAQRLKVGRSGAIAAYAAASKQPAWLQQNLIADIEGQTIEPAVGDFVAMGFTDEAILERARFRQRMLRKLIGPDYSNCHRFIEIGAADAMVAWALVKDGKEVLATDIQDEELDSRAVADGVPFALMSATDLKVPDASYDVLYSYDSMEHIDDPAAAMAEATRVVRPGGYVYFRFGPLYQAAEGMHLGTRLRVPYASVLFERGIIDDYMAKAGRDPLNHDYCNGWTLDQYRSLFKVQAGHFDTKLYLEHWDLSGIDLISRFPSCFKAKSENLDSFLVNVIEILLRRKTT